MNHTITFTLAANMKEKNPTRQKHAVIMKNVQKKVAQEWIVAKTKNAVKKMVWQKWIAAKTANAQRKVIMGKTAANKKSTSNNFKDILI